MTSRHEKKNDGHTVGRKEDQKKAIKLGRRESMDTKKAGTVER